MSMCLHMLLLLGWPFSYSLNTQSSNCAIDLALLLWLLKASYKQKTATRCCGVAASPHSVRTLRVWTVLFISIYLKFSQ